MLFPNRRDFLILASFPVRLAATPKNANAETPAVAAISASTIRSPLPLSTSGASRAAFMRSC
jgi:hypothetical protein